MSQEGKRYHKGRFISERIDSDQNNLYELRGLSQTHPSYLCIQVQPPLSLGYVL